jgi:hypothetical protein
METDDENNLYFYLKYKTDLLFGDDTIFAINPFINIALVKLDSEFNLAWMKYQDNVFNEYYNFPLKVAGNYIYYHESINFGDSTSIKVFDLNGNLTQEVIQTKTSIVSFIEVDSEGNLYVAGSCVDIDPTFGGVPFPSPVDPPYASYLVKYNPNGILQWVKFIGDVTCVTPQVVISDPDYIYFAGKLNKEVDLGDYHLDGSIGTNHYFIARLNSNRDFLWAKQVPHSLNGNVTLLDNLSEDYTYIEEDTEHNVLLYGTTEGELDWGNGIVTQAVINPSNGTIRDFLQFSYSPEGDIRYAITAGGHARESSLSITMGNNGEIYLTGIGMDNANFGNISIIEEGSFSILHKLMMKLSGLRKQVLKISY